MKLGKSIRNFAHHGGLSFGNVGHRLGLSGKKIKKVFGLNRLRRSLNSAGSYSYARGEYYGPTGSIVGRY